MKTNLKSKRNIILVMLTLALLILAPTCFYLGYQARAAPTVSSLVFEHPNSEYTYMMWNESTTYYAKNLLSGAIDYSGTNFITVIQACADQIAFSGQTIFLKCGTYNVAADEYLILAASYNLTIIGEDNQGTRIVKAAGGVAGSDTIIRGTLTSTNAPTLTLENIYFDCTAFEADSAIGQYFTLLTADSLVAYGLGTSSNNEVFLGCVKGNLVVRNCHIEDFAYSTWCYYYSYVHMSNNKVVNCGTVGFGAGKYPVENATVEIVNNIIIDCGWEDEGLTIDAGFGEQVTRINGLIADNICINPTDGKGNKNGNIAVIAVAGVTITGNHIYDTGTVTETSRTCGIKVSGDTDDASYVMRNITIQNNVIHSSNRGIYVKNAFASTIRDNEIHMYSNDTLRGIYVFYDTNCPAGNSSTYLIDNIITVETGGSSEASGIRGEWGNCIGGSEDIYIFRNTIKLLSGTDTGINVNFGTVASGYFHDNHINATNRVEIAGTAHYLNALSIPFVGGNDTQLRGWYIDASNEYAWSYAILPKDVDEVMGIRVYAISNITETHSMTADFSVSIASDNETYNNAVWYITTSNSTTANFTQDDIVHWQFGGVNIDAGNCMLIRVKYEAASGDHCATAAWFTCIEIYYV